MFSRRPPGLRDRDILIRAIANKCNANFISIKASSWNISGIYESSLNRLSRVPNSSRCGSVNQKQTSVLPLLVSYSSTNWTRLQKPMVEGEMTLEVPVTVAQPDPNEDGPHEVEKNVFIVSATNKPEAARSNRLGFPPPWSS